MAPVRIRYSVSHLTREQANEILTLWKLGLETYPMRTVRLALIATGDLEPEKQRAWIPEAAHA